MTLDAYEAMDPIVADAARDTINTATRNTIAAVGDSISDAISTAVEDTIRDATYAIYDAIDAAIVIAAIVIDAYVKDVTP